MTKYVLIQTVDGDYWKAPGCGISLLRSKAYPYKEKYARNLLPDGGKLVPLGREDIRSFLFNLIHPLTVFQAQEIPIAQTITISVSASPKDRVTPIVDEMMELFQDLVIEDDIITIERAEKAELENESLRKRIKELEDAGNNLLAQLEAWPTFRKVLNK